MIGLGFFCSTHDNKLSTNHKFRLSSLSREKVLATLRRNVSDLIELLKISKGMGLTIFRLGSDIIPFASHESFAREWMEEALIEIKGVAKVVRDFGIRITMHPGQFVVLNSPDERAIQRSLRELEYHFKVLDALGEGENGVVVVHVGGTYGDKRKAMKRFEAVVEENGWLKRRLAVENDEKHYTIVDVLELAETLDIPVVFDYLHHKLNPSPLNIERVIDTWRGIPEMHLSSQREGGRPGEHGEFVSPRDLEEFVSLIPEGVRVDVIIEAKKKEEAIEALFRYIMGRRRLLERIIGPWRL